MTSLIDPAPKVTEHYVQWRRVATPPKVIGANSLHHLEIVQRRNQVFNEMMVQLETFMLAEHLADETRSFDFKWPASAFQRFKLRHRRLKRFLPSVKYMNGRGTVKVRSWANFPECSEVFPQNFGLPVRYQEIEQTQLEPWL